MSDLGKCLLFYLKYPAEMERLYEAEEPNVKGLANPDQVLAKVKRVGDTANREVAELLEACAPTFEEHFGEISNIERVRRNLEKTWCVSFRVRSRKGTEKGFWIGVLLESKPAALFPYLWCPGGRRAEDEVIRVLGRGNKSPDWNAGCVWLKEIKIPLPEQLEKPVPCQPLVAQVREAFASFTAQEIKALAAIARNHRRP